MYINDTIGVSLDQQDNIQHISAAIPLAIHTLAHPIDPIDEIPRKEIIELKKNLAEGRPSETAVK
jgi:hypothetical protein